MNNECDYCKKRDEIISKGQDHKFAYRMVVCGTCDVNIDSVLSLATRKKIGRKKIRN